MTTKLETDVMNRRYLAHMLGSLFLAATSGLLVPAHAQQEAADAFIKRLSSEILGGIKADSSNQAGNVVAITALVDAKLMPSVNFKRMTASAVGPTWRQMTPEQQNRLQNEFKLLLIHTYAGALSMARDVTITVKPLHTSPDDNEVIVKSEITGHGDPIQMDYRLEKVAGEEVGWKIYNLNIMGVWLVETYRSQFVQAINKQGVDGLIATLSERNKSTAK
jgi:phospholipid transport system substrate-binding protein